MPEIVLMGRSSNKKVDTPFVGSHLKPNTTEWKRYWINRAAAISEKYDGIVMLDIRRQNTFFYKGKSVSYEAYRNFYNVPKVIQDLINKFSVLYNSYHNYHDQPDNTRHRSIYYDPVAENDESLQESVSNFKREMMFADRGTTSAGVKKLITRLVAAADYLYNHRSEYETVCQNLNRLVDVLVRYRNLAAKQPTEV